MTIDNFGYYEVQSVLGETSGSGFWHLKSASRATGLQITVYSKGDHDWFHFMFVEAGEPSTYYIVSRESGLPLRVNGMTDRVALTQDVYRPDHDAQYRFVLSPDHDDESVVTIEAYPSGNRLLVDEASAKNFQGIFAYAELPRGAPTPPVPSDQGRTGTRSCSNRSRRGSRRSHPPLAKAGAP